MADDQDTPQTMVLFPVGTTFFEPDDINQVTIMFPDADSAIIFSQWCRQLVIDTEKHGYG
jgi:hypothetical protein